jgi:pyridinium-3,5-biscarboxylic acid mononucleotide synthase
MAYVGVAGLCRLMRRLDEIQRHAVIIVAAGMDPVLPRVVAALVPTAISVPTSVGCGVAARGRAALDALLASCAPGITLVNIGNVGERHKPCASCESFVRLAVGSRGMRVS